MKPLPSHLDVKRHWFIVALLLANSALSAMSTDLYAPSMPDLPELLGTTVERVQLTLVLNVVGFGLAQLLIGPLSDRFGRRPVFIGGVAMFTLFSLGCGAAQNIDHLLLARALQGMAAAAEAVLVVAIFTDLFDEQARIKVLAIYGILFALAPGVAPIIGGYVHIHLGWRWNFFSLAVAGGLLCLLAALRLPETGQMDRGAVRVRQLLRSYGRLLSNFEFMRHSMMMAAIVGMLFAFLIEAPFLIIDLYGVPPQHYGYFHFAVVAAYIIGSLITTWLVDRVDSRYLLNASLALTLSALALLSAFELAGAQNLVSLVSGIALVFFTTAPMWAILPSRAMAAKNTGAGTAAAAFGTMEMLGAGICTALITQLHDGTTTPLVAVMLGTVLLSIALKLPSRRPAVEA